MPNGISTVINWTSPFPFKGVLGGRFYFNLNFDRTFCKQTVETLIRRRFLRRLVWVSIVCLCPRKRTLGLYGLTNSKINHENKNTTFINMCIFAGIFAVNFRTKRSIRKRLPVESIKT